MELGADRGEAENEFSFIFKIYFQSFTFSGCVLRLLDGHSSLSMVWRGGKFTHDFCSCDLANWYPSHAYFRSHFQLFILIDIRVSISITIHAYLHDSKTTSHDYHLSLGKKDNALVLRALRQCQG